MMQLTVGEIAAITGSPFAGDDRVVIEGVAGFDAAGATDLTYVDNARLLRDIGRTRAGAVIVPEDFEGATPCPLIRATQPQAGFCQGIGGFSPG